MSNELRKIAENNLIFEAVVGSQLYGCALNDSDHDRIGVFIPPKEYILGLQKCQTISFKDDRGDRVLYSLPHFLKLLLQNNPNILSTLFISKHVLFEKESWRSILDQKEIFLSTRIFHTFTGYAYSQRIKLLTRTPIGKRKKTIEKYGFDTKYAMHLIRLMDEGLELLQDKKITYSSRIRSTLLQIRTGQINLNDILTMFEGYVLQIQEALKYTTLPKRPNFKAIERLQIELLEEFYYPSIYS